MNLKGFARAEIIRKTEAEIKEFIIFAWLFVSMSVWFGCLSVHDYKFAQFPGATYWGRFGLHCLCTLLCTVMSVLGWYLVDRDRKAVARLRAIMAQETASKQPGVWPPPPRKPKR